MLTFEPFRVWLTINHPKKTQKAIQMETRLSKNTVVRIMNDKIVQTDAIDKLCKTYDLEVHEVIKIKSD